MYTYASPPYQYGLPPIFVINTPSQITHRHIRQKRRPNIDHVPRHPKRPLHVPLPRPSRYAERHTPEDVKQHLVPPLANVDAPPVVLRKSTLQLLRKLRQDAGVRLAGGNAGGVREEVRERVRADGRAATGGVGGAAILDFCGGREAGAGFGGGGAGAEVDDVAGDEVELGLVVAWHFHSGGVYHDEVDGGGGAEGEEGAQRASADGVTVTEEAEEVAVAAEFAYVFLVEGGAEAALLHAQQGVKGFGLWVGSVGLGRGCGGWGVMHWDAGLLAMPGNRFGKG